MSGIYRDLAPFYDAMNAEIDYETWADNVVATLQRRSPHPVQCILDLGCGTGSMTIPLAKRGFDVVGLDLSPEMLSVAAARAEKAGVTDRIQWTQQDMRDFSLYGTVDAAICTLDGINHLRTVGDLTACLGRVSEYLTPGGFFLFDLNSRFRFETVYADEIYTMETDRAFCVWQNDYRPKSKLCDFWITLFIRREDGTYLRRDSRETERYYPLATVKRCLAYTGFRLVGAVGDLTGRPIQETDEKWYCVAEKEAICQ